MTCGAVLKPFGLAEDAFLNSFCPPLLFSLSKFRNLQQAEFCLRCVMFFEKTRLELVKVKFISKQIHVHYGIIVNSFNFKCL